MNILFLTDSLDYVNGVTSHLFYLLSNLSKESSVNLLLVCSGGNAVSKFTEKGISVMIEKNLSHKNRNTFSYGSAVLSIRKIIKSNKIDIVHSHNHYAANISTFAAQFLKVKTIQTNHGIIPETGKLKHFTADHYIAVNENIVNYFKKVFTNNKNFSLIYNGIDFSENISVYKKKKVSVIAASRFEKTKGLDTYIKAVAILSKKYSENNSFLIAGEGTMENELKKLNSDLNAKINFIGSINNLKNVFEDTSIFIFPSCSDTEGLPMTILEAAACNNLIISSDFKGFEYIFNKSNEALFFNKNDSAELAEKIKYSLDNPEISENIAANFRLKAITLFSAAAMADKHFELYKKILN